MHLMGWVHGRWQMPGLALLACSMAACSSEPVEKAPAAPDRIFLITIDTLRADHLGSSGYVRPTSPFLDSLAAEGVLFRQVRSSASMTVPSHLSMFTGLEPLQHGVLSNGRGAPPELPNVGGLLASRGYSTAAFSSTSFLRGAAAGFDHYGGERDTYFRVDEVLERASRWIADQPPGAKLFVWIHLYDVHEWGRDGRLSDPDVAWAEEQDAERLWEFLRESTGLVETAEWSRDELIDWNNRYDAQIRWVDRELGEFFAEQRSALPESHSVWVVTSDHGEGLGNHDTRGHSPELYEEQLRVPLIFHSSADLFPRGTVVDDLVRLVDLGPTLADLGGAEFPDQPLPVVGRSLKPLLSGSKGWERRPGLAIRGRVSERIRDRRGWSAGELYSLESEGRKVILRTEGESEYYDLSADPFEDVNLISHDDFVNDARRLLRETRDLVGLLEAQGASFSEGEIDESLRQELEALGYL